MADTTTIQIETETWTRLNGMKEPGETFDEVVNRALDELDQVRGNGS